MKHAIFAIAVAFCALVGPAQAQREQPEPGPYEEHCVLIETFTVELSTEALADAGTDIRDYQGISVNRLIAALADDENGSVKSGLKIRTGHDDTANIRISEQRENRTMRGETPVRHIRYELVRSCNIERCRIDQSGRILISFHYQEEYPIASDNGDAPPPIYQWSFESQLRANSGEPHIVAATQDEETAMFVVFLATLEGPEVEPEAEPDEPVPTSEPEPT